MIGMRLNAARALGWLMCLSASGCGDGNSAPPSRTDPEFQQTRREALERRDLARVPPESPAAVQGEVPAEVMERIRAHLADRLGVPADAFETVRAESTEWPNGAMGCPQPGMNYTQAVVPGYRVVLRHQGREYDYRAARSGHFMVCESMQLDQPPAR